MKIKCKVVDVSYPLLSITVNGVQCRELWQQIICVDEAWHYIVQRRLPDNRFIQRVIKIDDTITIEEIRYDDKVIYSIPERL